MTTFRSPHANLCVHFPAQHADGRPMFGTIDDGMNYQYDQSGRAITREVDGKAVPVMRQRLKNPVQFKAGSFTTEDSMVIEDLRKHPGNQVNSGTEFFEEPEEIANIAAMASGRVSITRPLGGLTSEDRGALERLAKICGNKPINAEPSKIAAVRDDMGHVLKRFQVIGIIVPPNPEKVVILKGRIEELMNALEDAGFWPEKEQAA